MSNKKIKGVALRDIKLENAVLDDSENAEWPILKLCDFGFSKVLYMLNFNFRAIYNTRMNMNILLLILIWEHYLMQHPK